MFTKVQATAALKASPPAAPAAPAAPAPPAAPPAPPAPIIFPLFVIVIGPSPPESSSKAYSEVLAEPNVIGAGIFIFFG